MALQQKEKNLKESLRLERDKEINLVIRRLEEDLQQQKIESETSSENR